jgi:hypothetical protein
MADKIIKLEGWQGITRIDQRVICIQGFWTACSAVRKLPVVGVIYTVSGFADAQDGSPGIFLREIEPPHCGCLDKTLSFYIAAFRPINETPKKNERVTKMLDDILKEIKIDTRLPEDA